MSDIAIVSANIGCYDHWAPYPQQQIADEWRYGDTYAHHGEHPRLTAKRMKMLEIRPTGGYRWVIWVDANMRLTSLSFAEDVVKVCGNAPLAVWLHPDRTTIQAEAAASYQLAPEKYAGQRLYEQVAHYYEQGYDESVPLMAGGVVVWNLEHPDTEELAKRWLAENQAWSFQDQLSLPYVLWDMELEPALLPHDLRCNPWISIGPHLSSR